MSDSQWSHLHADEQQRLAEGLFNREELDALKRGENPWPKPVQQSPVSPKSDADDLRPFNEGNVEEGIGMAQPTHAPEGSEPPEWNPTTDDSEEDYNKTTTPSVRVVVVHLKAGLQWCASNLWSWTAVLITGPLLYALGVGAMFGNQPSIAARLYFFAIGLVIAKAAKEARSHKQQVGVIVVILFLGTTVFGVSLLWVQYTSPDWLSSPVIDWRRSDEARQLASQMASDVQKLEDEGRLIDLTDYHRATKVYADWVEKCSVTLGRIDK